MRFVEIDEKQKNVPVFKNVIYALKLTWKADKKLLLGYIFREGFFAIFSKYLQNILFLKIQQSMTALRDGLKNMMRNLMSIFHVQCQKTQMIFVQNLYLSKIEKLTNL